MVCVDVGVGMFTYIYMYKCVHVYICVCLRAREFPLMFILSLTHREKKFLFVRAHFRVCQNQEEDKWMEKLMRRRKKGKKMNLHFSVKQSDRNCNTSQLLQNSDS